MKHQIYCTGISNSLVKYVPLLPNSRWNAIHVLFRYTNSIQRWMIFEAVKMV